MKGRYIYLLISSIALGISIYSISMWGFKPSIDFTGGSVIEYKFENNINSAQVKEILDGEEKKPKEVTQISATNVQVKYGPDFAQSEGEKQANVFSEKIKNKPQVVRYEVVGPTLSQEILRKTFVAIALASLGILLWIAWQFKSIKFGISAILAMLHDTTILLGTFSLLGHFRGVEIDILFVTALLTILSFSVHDTIVVYDRIREAQRRNPRSHIRDLANIAISGTIVRSLNNSLTIIFMLLALFLLGGASIKWFVAALLVGTVAGTYSSPFVAVPLLVTWDNIQKRVKGN